MEEQNITKPKGSFLKLSLSFVFGIVFTVLLINFSIQRLLGNYLLEIANKKIPEIFDRKISIEKINISAITGKVILKNVKIETYPQVSSKPALTVPSFVIQISLQDLFIGKLLIRKVVLAKPVLNAKLEGISKSDSMLSYIAGLRSLNVGPRNLFIHKGLFIADIDESNELVIFSDFNVAIKNMPVKFNEDRPFSVELSASIPSFEKGFINLDLQFNSVRPNLDFEGEFKAKNVSIPYFSPMFREGDEVIVQNGTLEIRSNIHCVDNWLTESNVISINKLNLDISSKKIFGIPAEVATEFFESNTVTFDLPISGDIRNLNYDFETASTQVMYKALQGRFKSDAFTKKISERFGKKIGKKLDVLFAKLL
ncbi:hypothetical protein ACFL58_00330 [Elusimicrobiota bacterium]